MTIAHPELLLRWAKNMCQPFFFIRNPYMKFQNPSMLSSEVMLCIKRMKCKNAQLQRAITHEVFFRIYSNVNQIIYSSISIYSLGFKTLASIVFEILCWQDFIHIFSKGPNSGNAHILDKKKSMCQPYMKLQNHSTMHQKSMQCKIPWVIKSHISWSIFQNFLKS